MESILFLPLLIAIISFFIPKNFIKEFSLAFSLTFLVLSISYIFKFEPLKDFNFPYAFPFLEAIGCNFLLGIDSLGLIMVLLTNFVVLYVNIMAWDKTKYSGSFYGLVFFMQFALIGVFSSLNGFLFYIFWELALIPIYLIVNIWGEGENKSKTFIKFFIYTFVGSLFILAALILFSNESQQLSLNYIIMVPNALEGNNGLLFGILMLLGLGVKIPIFPLHSWQADTYQKAPAEGTVLLSGIMLKMGLYGLLRWFIPFIESSELIFQNIALTLAIIGVLYGAIIALRRNDLKLIAAFSSLSHVGLITAGILSYKMIGFQGSILQMLVHGINIVGIFYIIDLIETQTKTRNINELGGLASRAPRLATLSLIIILGTIAVPLSNGFPGEFLLLFSIYLHQPIMGLIAGTTIILGAAYMLRVYQRVFMGEITTYTSEFKDIQGIHLIALSFIALLVICIGIFPQYILNFTEILSNILNNSLVLKH